MRTLLVHVSAWTAYILLYATLWRDSDQTFQEALVMHLWLLPTKLLLVYTALGLLVPTFLRRRRYAVFLISLLALSITGGIVNQLMIHYVIPESVGVIYSGEAFWDIERISKRMTYLNSPLLFALTFEGIRMWYEQKELNTRLTKEKLAAELALLKGQLHPHFFFNTLNNLYSLTLQKSDLAPELILRLSDIMRYILDDSRKDLVPLKDELEFIRGYIGIEQVRYSGKVSVTTDLPTAVEGYSVPPLALFTFVENAFKHGVAHEVESAWIDIKLNLTGNRIIYVVKNSCPEFRNGQKHKAGVSIGLRNTEERLKITYGDDFEFKTGRSEDVFHATLEIKTARI